MGESPIKLMSNYLNVLETSLSYTFKNKWEPCIADEKLRLFI